MNTSKLARTTFVLDRTTHDQLDRITRRFGVSRSAFVREVLAEPVAMMARWVDQMPANQPVDAAALRAVMLSDLEGFVAENMETARHG